MSVLLEISLQLWFKASAKSVDMGFLLTWVFCNYVLQSAKAELLVWPLVSGEYKTTSPNKLSRLNTQKLHILIVFLASKTSMKSQIDQTPCKASISFEFQLQPFCTGCLYIALALSLHCIPCICAWKVYLLCGRLLGNYFGLECQ